MGLNQFHAQTCVGRENDPIFCCYNRLCYWSQKPETQSMLSSVRIHDSPALWRLGRLLLLELSSISMIVGAGLSDAGALWVDTVVGTEVVEGVPLVVVVVVVVVVVGAAVVSVGSATVDSTVSRTSSASLSSDWFSVMWWTVYVLAEWSEMEGRSTRSDTIEQKHSFINFYRLHTE